MTPYFAGISARSLTHSTRPVFSSCDHAIVGFDGDVAAAGVAIAGMVDDEIQLRPVLGGFADVAHVHKGTQGGELLFDRGREQSLVDADVLDAVLDAHLVGAIGGFLVVHAPGMAGEIFVGVVADGVALDGVGLEGHGAVEIVEPAGRAGREDGVSEHAAGAGGLVHFLAGCGHHFVGEEPVAGDFRGRAGDQSDFGVAIEEDFLVVVVVLEVLDGLLAAFHLRDSSRRRRRPGAFGRRH